MKTIIIILIIPVLLFSADADVEEVDTITSPTATSTAIAKTKKKKVKAVEQGIVSVASTSISASVKQTGPVLAVKDAVIAPVIATSTPPVLKGWIEVGGNKKTKAPKSATPVASIGPPLTQTTVSSNSSNPQTAPSQPVKVIRTINSQINNDFPKIPAVPKQTVAAQSPDATKSGSSATDPSSAPIAWSDNGRKTKTKVSVSGTAVTAKVASTDNSVVMPQSTSKGPLSAPKSYKEVISKQKADDKNTETLVPAIFTVNTKGSHTHLKDTTAPDSPLIDSESYDEEGLSMESMMQEFQALGSQSLESPFGYGLGQKSEPRYEDDDDLFEAIRSASIVTGLDLEHPFPLSEQYFDSFPTLSHQNSSLADFTDEFSDDFFNGVGLSKGPSLGLSQASLNDHSSSMLLSHSDAELASGFAGLAHFHQPNSMGASLTNMQSGLYSTGQLHALSHSYAHSPQYSEFLGGTPQALTSPSFQAHGPMQSKPGFTDKLSTTSTTTSNSVEYLSESYLQGQVSSSALSLGLNPILGLDLGTDSVHRVVEDTEGDPNPALIKESDLLISDEYARLDREKAFGESLFPATLWGRSVFVRKLNNNTTQGIIEPHPGDGEKLRLDFLRELQVLTDFRHQNILPLQAFSFWPMILVYPLLHDRLTLLELMSDGALMGSLHWSTRLRVISTLCNALTYVHHGCPELARPGIVHRYVIEYTY